MYFNFFRDAMRSKIATALSTQTYNLMVEQMPSHTVSDNRCTQAMVYFMGMYVLQKN